MEDAAEQNVLTSVEAIQRISSATKPHKLMQTVDLQSCGHPNIIMLGVAGAVPSTIKETWMEMLTGS
jgi:hypothetical protein